MNLALLVAAMFACVVNSADLDPIYFCELLKVCKIVDNGDAKFTSLEVHPATGRRGTLKTMPVYVTAESFQPSARHS